MSTAGGESAAGGWQPDPYGGGSWRWWDGRAWDAQTAPATEPTHPSVRSLAGRELEIRDGSRGFATVLADGVEVASIDASRGNHVHVTCGDGSWRVVMVGLGGPANVQVYVLPADVEIARFDYSDLLSGAGELRFPDGRTFPFPKDANGGPGPAEPAGLLGQLGELAGMAASRGPAAWRFADAQGRTVVSVSVAARQSQAVTDARRWKARLSIPPEAATTLELPLLFALAATLAAEWGDERTDDGARRAERARERRERRERR